MRSPLATLASVCVLVSAGGGHPLSGQATPESTDTTPKRERPVLRRSPAGFRGLTGLVHVPTAAAVPVGTVEVTADAAQDRDLRRVVTYQRNVFVTLGFLPRLTLTARGTVAREGTTVNEGRDLSASAQLLLLEEGSVLPALAVGTIDPNTGGAPHFTTYYAVATKTLMGRSRLTAGYGRGPKEPEGLFGGVELDLGPWLTALGEYDGAEWNGGVRIFPFPGLADRLGVQPRVDVVHRGGWGEVIGGGFRMALGSRRSRTPPPRTPAAPTLLRARVVGAEAVSRELVARGLENVRVSLEGGADESTLLVEYENRVFNRDEWDALGVVMGLVARHAPESAREMRITIRRMDVPVLTVTSGIEAFRSFVGGAMSGDAFAAQLETTHFRGGPIAGGPTPTLSNPSRGKLDLFLRPRVETHLLTDLGYADARFALLPDAYLHLGGGWVLNGRLTVELGETSGFPGFLEDPNADRLLVHKAFWVAPGWSSGNALTQFSLGWFRRDEIGVANEIDVALGEGRWSVGSTLAAFGPEAGKVDSGVALGNVRFRYPEMDLTASVEGGVFRRGDAGVSAELSRFFGDTEMGFFVRSTTFGTIAGMRLALPLTPSRELTPARIRPRLPDVYAHTQHITILADTGAIKRYVGRTLETDHEIERVYRGRDRILPGDLRVHVQALREAVLRWLSLGIL